MASPVKRKTVEFPADIADKLEDAAAGLRLSVSGLIKRLVVDFLSESDAGDSAQR